MCVTWSEEELGLCAGLTAQDCQLNTDCEDASASCQRALYLDASSGGKLAMRGFCLPALFFIRGHQKCEQGKSQGEPNNNM